MPRPTDEVRQLLVHPVVWPPLLSWLKARNIELSAQQFGGDDLPTYVMTPSTVTTEVGRDQLDTYVRIFKQLPREAVAELVAAVTTDPALHGRRTALAQAAMLVSVGHRLGWHDALPAVVPGGAGEEPELAADPQPVGAEFVQRLATVKVGEDATVDPAMCPRCKGDNREAFALCPACAEADGRLLCPRCGEDITDYAEDDHVFRTGDERPYCSGECVVAAHRAALKQQPKEA